MKCSKNVTLLSVLLCLSFTSCKQPAYVQNDSETESLESISTCRPGMFRWICRPTSDIFFAVKIDDGYCLYRSSYRGQSPDEKSKHVSDLFKNELYTKNFPQPYPKKFSREKLLGKISSSSDYIKRAYYDAIREELSNADRTPGRVNVDVKASTAVTLEYLDEFSSWMETVFFVESGAAKGSCPPPRALEKSR